MAVTLIICISVPLEMLLVYAAALKLSDIINPVAKPKRKRHPRKHIVRKKHASMDEWAKFQRLL